MGVQKLVTIQCQQFISNILKRGQQQLKVLNRRHHWFFVANLSLTSLYFTMIFTFGQWASFSSCWVTNLNALAWKFSWAVNLDSFLLPLDYLKKMHLGNCSSSRLVGLLNSICSPSHTQPCLSTFYSQIMIMWNTFLECKLDLDVFPDIVLPLCMLAMQI